MPLEKSNYLKTFKETPILSIGMTERYQHLEYEITDDPDYLFDLYQVPHELRRQFPSLHPDALKGGERAIRRMKKLIEQYPNVPQLKN